MLQAWASVGTAACAQIAQTPWALTDEVGHVGGDVCCLLGGRGGTDLDGAGGLRRGTSKGGQGHHHRLPSVQRASKVFDAHHIS